MEKIEQLEGLEDRLTAKLHAYQPNPQFVDQLRTRLTTEPGIELESHKSKSRILLATTAILGIASIILWLIFYIASFFKFDESN